MGPFRRGLILGLLPSPLLAEVCDKARPGWDGAPVSMLDEALALATSPVTLLLLVATAFAIRFRSQWGGLLTTVLWTGWISAVVYLRDAEIRTAAISEGCAASPALFVGIVAAICVATILYTAPRGQSDPNKETPDA